MKGKSSSKIQRTVLQKRVLQLQERKKLLTQKADKFRLPIKLFSYSSILLYFGIIMSIILAKNLLLPIISSIIMYIMLKVCQSYTKSLHSKIKKEIKKIELEIFNIQKL